MLEAKLLQIVSSIPRPGSEMHLSLLHNPPRLKKLTQLIAFTNRSLQVKFPSFFSKFKKLQLQVSLCSWWAQSYHRCSQLHRSLAAASWRCLPPSPCLLRPSPPLWRQPRHQRCAGDKCRASHPAVQAPVGEWDVVRYGRDLAPGFQKSVFWR